MQISVLVASRTVVVDGIALACDFDAPEGMESLFWHGATAVGQINGGAAHGALRDPSVVAPYVAAWRSEMQRRLAAIEQEQAAEQAAYVAEEQRREAERQAQAAAVPSQPSPASGGGSGA